MSTSDHRPSRGQSNPLGGFLNQNAELIYVADPTCSWCWGFAPTISALKERFQGRLELRLMMGGLRPGGAAEPLGPELKRTLSHHWQDVARRTGQEFDSKFFERTQFLYDTEPPSRAVLCFRILKSEGAFDYFKSLQRAFYAQNKDITDPSMLEELAAGGGVERGKFRGLFDSGEAREAIWMEFDQVRRLGVSAFPTSLLRRGDEVQYLSRGYRPLEELEPRVTAFLEG